MKDSQLYHLVTTPHSLWTIDIIPHASRTTSRSSLSLVTVSGGTEWQMAQQSAGETVLMDIASYSVTSIRRPASSVTTLTYSIAKSGCAPIDCVRSRMGRLH